MTSAVMMRATLGHSGRALEAGKTLSVIFCLLVSAALVRAFLPDIEAVGMSGLWLAASLWIAAYAGFIVQVGPWLIRPKQGQKLVSKPGS